MTTDTRSQNDKNSESPTWVLVLFLGLFAAVGTLIFWLFTVSPGWTYLSARSWVETPCKILASEVATIESRGTGNNRRETTYQVAVRYAYVVDGQEYEGTRYNLMDIATKGRKKKLSIVKKYPVGTEAKCYVDPRDPEASIIDRSASLTMLWGVLSFPFMFIGYGGIAWIGWVTFGRRVEAIKQDPQS